MIATTWRAAVLLVLTLSGLASAQPAPNILAADPESLTLANVNARISELRAELEGEGLPDAEEEHARQALEQYQRALAALERAREQRSRVATLTAEAGEAPTKLAAIREELARAPEAPKVAPAPDATLPQLEQQLSQAVRDLEAARKEAADLTAEATRRDQRRREIQDRIPELRRARGELDQSLGAPSTNGEPARVAESRRAARLAERRALDAEIAALEAEAASYDARRELLPARLDRALRRVQQGERLVNEWQGVVNARRESDASQAAEEARRLRRAAARQHPVLRDFAAESELLAAQSAGAQGLPTKISEASRIALETAARLASLQADSSETRQRVVDSGLNRATGLMLRGQFDELPDTPELRRRLADTDRELASNAYSLEEIRDARRGAGDIDRVARELTGEIEDGASAENRADLEAAARDLATARRDLLDSLIAARETYDDRLQELHENLRALLDESERYRSFIEQHILWVRSVAGDPLPSGPDLESATDWVADHAAWRDGLARALDELARRWPVASAYLAGVLLLIGAGYAARRRLRVVAKGVGSYRTDRFSLTLRALALTVVIGTGGPALMWFFAWALRAPGAQGMHASALGAGLEAAALVWLPLAVLRHALRPNGLAITHFRWRPEAARAIRARLRWFTPLALVATTVVAGLEHSGAQHAYTVYGRAAFTLGTVAGAVLLAGVLRPGGPVVAPFLARNAGGWLDRLRYLWYPGAVLLPVALAGVAWAGYFYTALRLESGIANTLVLVFSLIAVHALLTRWLFIERRRVAVEEARRRREQATAGEPVVGEGAPIEEDRLDLPAISSQTRQLFRAGVGIAAVLGLYLVWADVTPALRMLDRVQVYPEWRDLDGAPEKYAAPHEPAPPASAAPASGGGQNPSDPARQLTGAIQGGAGGAQSEGGPAAAAGEQTPISVTLADIGAALLILIATWVVFRNLPGLAEIVLLQRLPLDAGSRYALSTVLRYAIAIVGVALAFSAIEIPWSKVQWLAAALTFGLAFGLQEIFANFVSGLIILAERPFRVGDTITVNNVTGSVSRIRMRATTVTDWDLKELVIPNKTFITGEIVNWSLSDPMLRVTIPVGVSYSSDTDKVERILLRLGRTHKDVLKEPAPQAWFRGFGDSTLNFELRVFIPSIDHLLRVRHDLHQQILKTFRDEDIEIAFPQRDLHIRTAEPLRDLIRGEHGQSADDPPARPHESRRKDGAGARP